MAVGTPVIASNIHGIPELLENGKGGILIEPNNTDEIVKAVNFALNNPEKLKNFNTILFLKG